MGKEQRIASKTLAPGLIKRLKKTAVRVGVSKIHGCGLLAVRPIAKGEKIFCTSEPAGPHKSCQDGSGILHCELPVAEVEKLEKSPDTIGIANMVRAYMAPFPNNEGKKVFAMPWFAMDRLHPIWYINDGGKKTANVKYGDLDKLHGGGLIATRNIETGEELLSNYDDIDTDSEDDGEHGEKEYPKDKAWAKAKAEVDAIRKEANTVQKRLSKAKAVLEVASHRAAKAEQQERKKKDH